MRIAKIIKIKIRKGKEFRRNGRNKKWFGGLDNILIY